MTLTTSTLRPGLMIRLAVSTTGNRQYSRTSLYDGIETDGSHLTEWNTRKHVEDPQEQERADKARSKCRTLIRSVCVQAGEFGLLCLKRNRDKLDTAITEAQEVANAFNRTAELTRVNFRIMVGEILQDDGEAMRAVGSEITALLDQMEDGVAALDVDAIRAAATSARQLAQMLEPGVGDKVEEAIELARQSASEIRKAETKNEPRESVQTDRAAVIAISAARAVFLDLDEAATMAAPVLAQPQLDI